MRGMAPAAEDIVANLEEEPGWFSLKDHPPELRDHARKALVERDALGFLSLVDNRYDDAPDPAVFRTTVQEPEILFYSNERQEEEFCVNLPPCQTPDISTTTPMS